jgi:hypothetical protein
MHSSPSIFITMMGKAGKRRAQIEMMSLYFPDIPSQLTMRFVGVLDMGFSA